MSVSFALWKLCIISRFEINVTSSKFAALKSHLPHVKDVVSKKLLSGNSESILKEFCSESNFLEEQADFHIEIILLFIRQNTIPYGQRHYECL